MEVRLNSPELEAKVNRWVLETGRPADELLADAMASYFDELEQTRAMLDRRYDDIKSGKVKPIPGDEIAAELGQRIAELRSQRS